MEMTTTLLLLIISVAIIGIAIWRDSVPRKNGKAHWFSWKPVLMVFTVIFIVLLVHILNMFGIETGQGRGRS